MADLDVEHLPLEQLALFRSLEIQTRLECLSVHGGRLGDFLRLGHGSEVFLFLDCVSLGRSAGVRILLERGGAGNRGNAGRWAFVP